MSLPPPSAGTSAIVCRWTSGRWEHADRRSRRLGLVATEDLDQRGYSVHDGAVGEKLAGAGRVLPVWILACQVSGFHHRQPLVMPAGADRTRGPARIDLSQIIGRDPLELTVCFLVPQDRGVPLPNEIGGALGCHDTSPRSNSRIAYSRWL